MERKYLSPNELRTSGALHEINRLVLHPLGLALEINLPAKGDYFTARVWDCRDDPEGIYFDQSTLSAEKAKAACDALMDRRAARMNQLGYVIQIIPGTRVLTVNYVANAAAPSMEFER